MNHLEWNNLPVVDWELGKRLAGNQADLAEDMMAMLKRSLPQEFSDIQSFALKQDYTELLRCVHKLHGAASYCGTPKLKALLDLIERKLRADEKEVSHLISDLDSVVKEMMRVV